MQEQDRKVAWALVVALATIAFALLWLLFVGPSDYHAGYTAKCEADCDIPWWHSASFWLVFFTAALTASTIGLWLQTKRLATGAEEQSHDMKASIAAAQRAADAAVAAQRPWLDFEFSAVEPLVFDVNGCSGTFKIKPINIGNTPAVRVRESVILTPIRKWKEPFEEGFRLLAARREKFGSGHADGHTLFPREKKTGLTYNVKIPQSEIEAAAKESANGLIQFHAVVAVDYEFAGGAGSTIRNYFVWTSGTEEHGKWAMLEPSKGTYSVDDIAITGIPAKNSAK